MFVTPTPTAGIATAIAVTGWQVQSSALVPDDGAAVSAPHYRATGWLEAPPRSTVMAAMLAAGRLADVGDLFFSTAMRDAIDPGLFRVPWWYRTQFTVSGSGRTLLRTEGVIHKAELWVNGTRVAGTDEVAGAYPVHTFDVSALVVQGVNALALRVHPGDPMTDLSVGWIDWNPTPPDTNMGVWRDVVILRTGDVRLADPHVRTELSDGLDHADLQVAVDVENAGPGDHVVALTGLISGAGRSHRFSREIRVSAGERRRVHFTAAETPALSIADPAVWWPVGQGEQPLHELRLTAVVDGVVSDQTTTSFGIRQVTSRLVAGGGRQFIVNKRPVQVLGGGWCPDIFLRYDPQRLRDELNYTIDMGLNAIRLEGKLENPEFYDLTDQLGIMVLPGWECCNKWEAHAGTGGAPWSEQDYLIARRSMASEARLLRNHPSVVSFQIGSDFAPPAELADIYVNELKAAEWSLPIVSSGASEHNNAWASGPSEFGTTATAAAGESGMKMWPYDWVPPIYWYDTTYGAAGFDSECSAGHSIPRLPSLRKMLAPGEIEQLWQQPSARQYHSAPSAAFDNLAIFSAALAARYGEISSLQDFLRKAQLTNYEMVRAQFEAYGGRFGAERPATGVIYWMLNTAWPSLNWHLYDYYLDPAGAYFGAKKANEPVHVQLSYDTGEVLVVNRTPIAAGPFGLTLVVRDVDGSARSTEKHEVGAVRAAAAITVTKPEIADGISKTYFLELELSDRVGKTVSRNVYWLSTQVDAVDWEKTSWQYSPQSVFADFTGLQELPQATVEVEVNTSSELANGTSVVTLRNVSPGATPAVGVHASIVAGAASSPVAPVLWDDNDITLFGGQSVTLAARYSTAGLDVLPSVSIEGFNLKEKVVC
jgi:exo-1,4-beta-D-glucosaminidase